MEINITEYKEEYAKQILDIIVKNLLEVNSKDYGIEYAKKHAEGFPVEKIKEDFDCFTSSVYSNFSLPVFM